MPLLQHQARFGPNQALSMRSIAMVVAWSVFLSVCLSVNHEREPCESGAAGYDRCRGLCESRELHVGLCGPDPDPLNKGEIFGGGHT